MGQAYRLFTLSLPLNLISFTCSSSPDETIYGSFQVTPVPGLFQKSIETIDQKIWEKIYKENERKNLTLHQ